MISVSPWKEVSSGLSYPACWPLTPICLSLCQSHTAVVTIVLSYVIEPGVGNPQICPFFQDCSADLNCLEVSYEFQDEVFWHPISKVQIVGERSGETPPALRCLSHLLNSFLTDLKHLAITQQGGTRSVPFSCLCQSFPYLCYTLIKLCYTKSSKQSSLVSDSGSKSPPSKVMNPGVTPGLQQQPFSINFPFISVVVPYFLSYKQ